MKLIKRHHLEWDLGFMYTSPPPVDDDGSSQPDSRGGSVGGSEDYELSSSIFFLDNRFSAH